MEIQTSMVTTIVLSSMAAINLQQVQKHTSDIPKALTSPAKRIHTKLRDARLASGMTQAQLAKKLRTDQSVISHWEAGTRTPRLRSLRRLCRVLKLEVAEVVA